MNTVLRCEKLYKTIGFNEILTDISFNVKRGDLVCVIGKLGAGKSSLFNVLASIDLQTSGKVFVNGMDKDGAHRMAVRSRIALVSDKDTLDSNISLFNNLELRGQLYGVNRTNLSQKIDYLLKLFDLENYADTEYGKLSVEKRKRADFARALINNPNILLIDDGYTVIERNLIDKIFNYIDTLRQTNDITVVMATKYFPDAERADKLLFMHNGKIMKYGAVHSILSECLSDKLVLHEPYSQDYNKYFAQNHINYEYKNHSYYIEISIGDKAVAILRDLKIKHEKIDYKRVGVNELYEFLNQKYDAENIEFINKLSELDGKRW